MTDRDFEKVLADLRLYRERIEETILTLDRLIANHKKAAFPSWLKRAVPRAQDQPKITYRSMLANLRRERIYVERAILYIERLKTGKSRGTPPPRWQPARKSGARG